MAPNAAGVGHRPEQVEHRGNADLAPTRAGKAECGMELGRKAEPDAGVLDAARDTLGAQFDGHPQCLQHVSSAALR